MVVLSSLEINQLHLVRDFRLLIVEFDDGTTGMVRKQSSFKPKHGLVMEVRRCEDGEFYELVGEYRDNGVRLDK